VADNKGDVMGDGSDKTQDISKIISDDMSYRERMMRFAGNTEKSIEILERNDREQFKRLTTLESDSHNHDGKGAPQSTTYTNGQPGLNGKAKIIALQSGGAVAALWIVREIIVAVIKFAGN